MRWEIFSNMSRAKKSQMKYQIVGEMIFPQGSRRNGRSVKIGRRIFRAPCGFSLSLNFAYHISPFFLSFSSCAHIAERTLVSDNLIRVFQDFRNSSEINLQNRDITVKELTSFAWQISDGMVLSENL